MKKEIEERTIDTMWEWLGELDDIVKKLQKQVDKCLSEREDNNGKKV